ENSGKSCGGRSGGDADECCCPITPVHILRKYVTDDLRFYGDYHDIGDGTVIGGLSGMSCHAERGGALPQAVIGFDDSCIVGCELTSAQPSHKHSEAHIAATDQYHTRHHDLLFIPLS